MSEFESALSARASVKPEILAPAGDRDSLIAALRSGADAIYFGLDLGFNARARAANFTLEGLAETVALIHRSGAKAYLTLNTLVFEPELAAVERVIRGIASAGADAIIVQDPAVCLLAREIAPDLHLHASTQMTVSSSHAARFAGALGVRRVVVPRELSVAEIGAFRAGTPLELEVFVHGALCVSWSGQCLTSEAWSGRSANRGQCAQSCRLPYSLEVDGVERELGDVKYLLSPKDLAGARAVPELARLGVSGLKIEGRQKGRAYVATAVEGYRRLVDGLDAEFHASEAVQQRGRVDLGAMTLSYTRGFSDGFLGGSDHQSLVEGRFPKHRGALLGRVVRVERDSVVVASDDADRPWTGALAADATARREGPRGEPASPLPEFAGSPGAGITIRAGMGVVFDSGTPEDKNEPGGPVFTVERRGAKVVLGFGTPGPDLTRVRPGNRVWITSDPEIQRRVEKEVAAGPPLERLPVTLEVSGTAGSTLRVVARCGVRVVAAESASPLASARSGGIDAALLGDKLGSFGGTPFVLATLDASALDNGLHLPVSELKALRRRVVDALEGVLRESRSRAVATDEVRARVRARLCASAVLAPPGDSKPRVVPLCRTAPQLDAVIEMGAEEIPEVELDFMDLVGLKRAAERAKAAGFAVILAGLRVEKPGEDSYFEGVVAARPDALLIRNWSALVRARALEPRPRLDGDFSLNVTNSLTALHLLGSGLTTLTPGYDLDADQLRALLDHVAPHVFTLPLWHRVPAFHTEHCVYSHLLSNGRDFRSCGRPCESHTVALRDEKKQEHPVIVDAGCRNTVFDGVPQSTASLVPELIQRGVRRFRVEFLREDAAATRNILTAARSLLASTISPRDFDRRTHARSRVGVGDVRMVTLSQAE